MKKRALSSTHQSGSMLLEALIAVLLFSIGILAIVGMQAAAVRASSDAKYRTDACMLVNQLIGQMWSSDRTPANMQNSFQGGSGTDGASYTAWLANVQATLPGAGANLPSVTFAQVPPATPTGIPTTRVTITVWWLAPGEPITAAPHQHTVVTQIGG